MDELFDLKDKVIVITGAGGALCGAMAKVLAEVGAKIAVLDLIEEAANKVTDEIKSANGTAIAVRCNVLQKDTLDAAKEKIVAEFGRVDILVPLDRLGNNRGALLAAIDELEAGGDTALLDGVAQAQKELYRLNDSERINAIVVMTDGQENASHISILDLQNQLRRGNESNAPVVIFAIAYGRDADHHTLEQLAEPTGGQVREGTVETIRELYKILSTYF